MNDSVARPRFSFLSILFFLFCFSRVCHADVVNSPLDYGTVKSPLFIYSNNSTRPYTNPRIQVCWMPTSSPNYYLQQAVRDQIHKTFEAYSSLHFIGWGTCQNDAYSSGIRINIITGQPRTSPGSGAAGNAAGNMNLNFTYETFDSPCVSNWGNEACVRWTAVHEFGHAISAAHEHLRPDTPSDCTQWLSSRGALDSPQLPSSQAYVPSANKTWDWHSNMNYCNESAMSYNGNDYGQKLNLLHNNGGLLSSIDVPNWQSIYGSSKTYSSSSSLYGTTTDSDRFYFLKNSSRASQPYQQPDLFTIKASGVTPSGMVEITGASASSNYQNLIQSATVPLALNNNTRPYEYGYSLATLNSTTAPFFIYLTRNPSTGTTITKTYSGSTNWQKLEASDSINLDGRKKYKITFADYNKDGVDDLIAVAINTDSPGNYTDEVRILAGPYFTSTLASSIFPSTPYNWYNCRYIAGNFYNHPDTFKGLDLVCMGMDSYNYPADSAPMNIIAWPAGSDVTNPYYGAIQLGSTYIYSDDSRYADFGIWQNETSVGSGKYPGDGIKIGYIKQQKTYQDKVEVYFLNSSLYF